MYSELTGYKRGKIRNQRIFIRVFMHEKMYIKSIAQKTKIGITQLVLASVKYYDSQLINLPRNPLETLYLKHQKEEEDMAIADYCIQRQAKKITYPYEAMAHIKKCLSKATNAREMQKLVNLYLHKTRTVYKEKQMTSFFIKLKAHLNRKHVYMQMRMLSRQTAVERMLFMLDKVMKEEYKK